MIRSKFEKLIKEAVAALPEKIRNKMDNVAIVVENNSSKINLQNNGIKFGDFLLGLYQGIPKTIYGRGFTGNIPDKITIFQEPIEKLASSNEEIKELVQIVVWHEIAHYFGFNEKKVKELEEKWWKKLNKK